MEQHQTDINYDAVNLDLPGGPSDPYDDASAFRALLGAVHGEFNNIVNNNITSSSNSLRPVNGKQILEKGVLELMGNKQPQPAPAPAPQHVPQVAVKTASTPVPVEKNTDQLEFNFDYSATAQKIYDSLDTIESKLDTIIKLFDRVTLQKKRVKPPVEVIKNNKKK